MLAKQTRLARLGSCAVGHQDRGTSWTTPANSPAGALSSGIGLAMNKRRHGFAIQRAQRRERATLALSVAIPVFAYIWR